MSKVFNECHSSNYAGYGSRDIIQKIGQYNLKRPINGAQTVVLVAGFFVKWGWIKPIGGTSSIEVCE